MESEMITWAVKKDAVIKAVSEGKRLDGRQPYEYRPIELMTGISGKAEGSCIAKIGDTQVMVGIKMDIKEPFGDTPENGNIMTGCELSPVASPLFEPGPPREEAIELARVVDRGVRESHMIDLEKLCIVPKEKVWNVLIDIHVLNDSGNLFDAANLAAVKALHTARLPKYEDEKIIYTEHTDKLPVTKKPISCHFARLGRVNILDPSLEEDMAKDCSLVLVSQDEGKICAAQKSGIARYTQEEIEGLYDLAVDNGKILRKLI